MQSPLKPVPVAGARHQRGVAAGHGQRLLDPDGRRRPHHPLHREPGDRLVGPGALPGPDLGHPGAEQEHRRPDQLGAQPGHHPAARARAPSSASRRRARPAPPQSNTDGWFTGYTCSLTASVWMGYPDGETLDELPRHRTPTAAAIPATIWRKFMTAGHPGPQELPLQPPVQRRGQHHRLRHRRRHAVAHLASGSTTTTVGTLPSSTTDHGPGGARPPSHRPPRSPPRR